MRISPLSRLMRALPLLALVAAGPAAAQARVADVPFGPGERAHYQVKLGGIGVGSGTMEVLGLERVRGHLTYHARLSVSGGIPLARVDDKFESWIDVEGLFSRRFVQDQKEVRYKRKRHLEFYPEERAYYQVDKNERGSIPTDQPLDEVSMLYYARTLPLRPGDEYRLNRYFQEDGNPVVLRVLRRDTVTVPAGTFATVVVRPIVRTKGLFAEGGEAEVYFTDDSRRLIVLIRSRVPVVGHLTLHLQSYRPGEPVSSSHNRSSTQ